MKRLMEKMVFRGLVMAWRLATWPTSRSPSLVNATTEGVVRPPSALGMTTGSPPSITATTELVVPRSMPITFSAILISPGERKRSWIQGLASICVLLRGKHGAGNLCHIGGVLAVTGLLSVPKLPRKTILAILALRARVVRIIL